MGTEPTRDLFAPNGHPNRREDADSDPFSRRLRFQDSRGRLDDTLADIEADVVAGLGMGHFHLLYQPRVSLQTLDVVAAARFATSPSTHRGQAYRAPAQARHRSHRAVDRRGPIRRRATGRRVPRTSG